MGHKEITKVPRRSISWSAGPGYVTFKTGDHVPITEGTICKFLPTTCPQGQQEPPNACKELLFPKATSKCLFALTPGPLEQAGEYSPIFPCLVSGRHP